MSTITFPASKPGKESPADSGFGDCCGQRPILLTWKRHKYLVGVICQNPNCENHQRGVLAYDVDAVEKWEKYRNPQPVQLGLEVTL